MTKAGDLFVQGIWNVCWIDCRVPMELPSFLLGGLYRPYQCREYPCLRLSLLTFRLVRMSELKIKIWSMPAADLGTENPFPPLVSNQELHIAQSVDPAVPDEIRQNMIYGHVPNILPYAMQDGYNRE